MTKVKIKVDFQRDSLGNHPNAEKTILAAFKTAGVNITKFRTTYVENENGIADMPHKLMLALLITDTRMGLDWYLARLNGEYTFRIKK